MAKALNTRDSPGEVQKEDTCDALLELGAGNSVGCMMLDSVGPFGSSRILQFSGPVWRGSWVTMMLGSRL